MSDQKPPRKGLDWSAIQDEGPASPVDSTSGSPGLASPGVSPPVTTTAFPSGPSTAGSGKRRVTLMDLCTPIFGYASLLPRQGGGGQPSYQTFRDKVMRALKDLEAAAGQQGIDREDVVEASYALCLFFDEQVADSEWSARHQWAAEPLHIVIHQDPEGGVNFFQRLEALGDRQTEVKEVFLTCLALGFRGQYAEFEPAQQAAQIGGVRQRVLRDIQPQPLDKKPHLLPDGYCPVAGAGARGISYPKWWLPAGIGIAIGAILVWVILFVFAYSLPKPAEKVIRPLAQTSWQVPGSHPIPAPAEGRTV